MTRKNLDSIAFLVLIGISLSAAAECYRFDKHLADAKQVVVTPLAPGVGSRPLFSPEGVQAWQLSGRHPDSQSWVEGDRLIIVTKGADQVCSPALELDLSDVGRLELELRVEGQDTVQLTRKLRLERMSCDIPVPRQGELFTAQIDPRAQDGWLYAPADQLMIAVNGPARLEIRAVRAVFPLLAVPVGLRMHRAGDSIRQVLFAQCPMALEYTLRVPQNAVFTAGLNVFAQNRPVAFSVVVRSGDTATEVLSRSVDITYTWSEVEADLSAFADKEVTITLGAACEGPGQAALWSNPAVLERRRPGASAPPNVVLYVVDALRADDLDVYGYPRKTAPAVTDFAEKGVKFDWCLSQATWTQVSVPTYHTGVGPLVHNVNLLTGESVPTSLVTFAELLRDAGYTTCTVTDNPLAPAKTAPRCSYGMTVDRSSQETTTERAARFLEANRDRPFLLYMHTMEAHCTVDSYDEKTTRYDAPPPFKGMFSSGETPAPKDFYDDGVAHAGKNFGDLLEKLATMGLSENTLVIFCADHGEAFLEHGMITHGGAPYMELIHVPLLVSWPGVLPAGKNFGEAVSLLDIAPTILDYAGIPIPAQFQGMSLRGLIEGTGAGAFQERTVFSHGKGSIFEPATDELAEHFLIGPMMGISPKLLRLMYTAYFDDVFSAVKPPWALWRKQTNGPVHLYNLAADPGEMQDVAEQNPDIVKAMSEQVDGYRRHEADLSAQLGTSEDSPRNTMDRDQREALKTLGYFGHSGH